MTTVNVTQTPASPVSTTWAAASSYAWNSPYAESSWLSARDPVAFDLSISETIASLETVSKDVSRTIVESFAVSESRSSAIALNKSESLAISEQFSRVATFYLALSEAVGIVETVPKSVGISKSDSFSMSDEIRRNSLAVISDVLIGQSDITDLEFDAILQQAMPVGYGEFVPFMEGDHEYQRAIFKAVITAADSSRPRLTALEVNVDVPDMFDSGAVTITPGGTTVWFSRPFNLPPEVNLTLKGGTVFCIPRVRDITRFGFTAELFDSSNVSVAGTATWKAHGF